MLFKDAEGIRMRDIAFAVVAVAVAVGVNVNVSVSRTHLCVTGSHFNGCLIAWPVPGLIEREGSEREQEREGGGGVRVRDQLRQSEAWHIYGHCHILCRVTWQTTDEQLFYSPSPLALSPFPTLSPSVSLIGLFRNFINIIRATPPSVILLRHCNCNNFMFFFFYRNAKRNIFFLFWISSNQVRRTVASPRGGLGGYGGRNRWVWVLDAI